jgi:hypothetical protein
MDNEYLVHVIEQSVGACEDGYGSESLVNHEMATVMAICWSRSNSMQYPDLANDI